MGALAICWRSRTSDEWLKDAARFARMAKRFNHHPQLNARFSELARDAAARARRSTGDLDYFRMRAATEKAAAATAADERARRAHLEMAACYQTLIWTSEDGHQPRLTLSNF